MPVSSIAHPLTFSIARREDGGPLTKRIFPTDDGKGFAKDGGACRMSRGVIERREAATLDGLAETLSGLSSSEALILGAWADGAASAAVVARAAADFDGDGPRARVKDGPRGLTFMSGSAGILLLDFDIDPARAEGFDGTPEAVVDVLVKAVPVLAEADMLVRPSTSSSIWTDGERLDDPKTTGFHAYVAVRDAAEIPEILKRITDRLWMAGRGFIRISAAGSRLYRTPVDAAVGSPERLIFIGPPILEGGLTQGERPFLRRVGRRLDLEDLPPLSIAEQIEVADLRETAYTAAAAAATEQRRRWLDARIAKLAARYVAEEDMKPAAARARAQAELSKIEGSILCGGVTLVIDAADGEADLELTVDEVLEANLALDGVYMRDPTEPEAGPQKARLHVDGKGAMWVFSWLHGGKSFLLQPSYEGLCGRIAGWADHDEDGRRLLLRHAMSADLTEAEHIDISDKLADVGVRRGDQKRLRREGKAHAAAAMMALNLPNAADHALRRWQVRDDATQSEIAADAIEALTVAGVKPIFDLGDVFVWTPARGIWTPISTAALQAWIGSAYPHCEKCERQSDHKGIRGAIEDRVARPGFFDNSTPGFAAAGRYWRVTPTGITNEALSQEHRSLLSLPFAPIFDGDPKMIGELADLVFKPETRDDKLRMLGTHMGVGIAGLGPSFKSAGIWLGAPNSGKSSISGLLDRFLPRDAVSVLRMSDMVKDTNLATLARSRVNIAPEEDVKKLVNPATLKAITGGDEIKGKFLYKNAFRFRPRCFCIFPMNAIPPLAEWSSAVMIRFSIIQFDFGVPAGKSIGSSEEAARLMFESEGATILGWALTCAAEALAQGSNALDNAATLEVKAVWRREEDPLMSFFGDADGPVRITGQPVHSMFGKEVYDHYVVWAEKTRHLPLGRNKFFRACEDHDLLQTDGLSVVVRGDGRRQFFGMRLRGEVDEPATEAQKLRNTVLTFQANIPTSIRKRHKRHKRRGAPERPPERAEEAGE